MLNEDDVKSLRGVTIADADQRDRNGRQVLRLHLVSGNVLAVTADSGGGLDIADETSSR